jgi:DNA polymerase kappa
MDDEKEAAAAPEAERALPPLPMPPQQQQQQQPWQTFSTVFTNAKAGMQGVDAERIKKIVYEASVGSAFHENEERKRAAADARTAETLERVQHLTPADLARNEARADAQLAQLEAHHRDLSRVWLVVDMDAFFASVEELRDPSLRGVPMAVGGQAMITTANYLARKYGVRSAMPGFIAVRLCPHLRFTRPDFEAYQLASGLVRKALAEFDPMLEMASLDEAYLDVTDWLRRERQRRAAGWESGGAKEEEEEQVGGGAAAVAPPTTTDSAAPFTAQEIEALAERVRAAVRERTGGLTCSVGAAPNRPLAKICADLKKPDGQFVLPCFPSSGGLRDGDEDDDDPTTTHQVSAEAVRHFVASLPIRKVPGVGRVTERALSALGVSVCADVIERRAVLAAVCSPSLLDFLFGAALGLGTTRHVPPPPPGELRRKGISVERTFSSARSAARGELAPLLESLAESLAEDMAREGLEARTLTLKLKLARTFELRTRSATLEGGAHARSAAQMMPVLQRLLRAEGPELELRLMGVRASGLRVTRERRRQELAEAGGEGAAGGPIERMMLAAAARVAAAAEGGGEAGRAAPPPPPPPAPAPSPARPPPAASVRWACGACTLLNLPLSLRCEACGERKGGGFGLSAAAAGKAHGPPPPTAAPSPAKQQQQDDDGDDDPLALLMCGEGEEAEEGEEEEDHEGGERAAAGAAGTPPLSLTPSAARSAYWCDRCGARLDARDAQEHSDYHLAADLQNEEDERQRRGGGEQQHPKKQDARGAKRSRTGGQQHQQQHQHQHHSIESYFTKASKP